MSVEQVQSEDHVLSEPPSSFKDYYSQDNIYPYGFVSTIWDYEPQNADEFHLKPGDVLQVLGSWDGGWATGMRVQQKAEDWILRVKAQGDNDISHGSSSRPLVVTEWADVKAFPLVCVTLPQHWKKAIEGESTCE